MTHSNNLPGHPIQPAALRAKMLVGAVIGLALIGAFLSGVNHPRPEWGAFWMVKPLIMVPLAGATGGACYYFINRLFAQAGWNKGVAVIVSFIVFIIGLWLGSVLGLNGTLWN